MTNGRPSGVAPRLRVPRPCEAECAERGTASISRERIERRQYFRLRQVSPPSLAPGNSPPSIDIAEPSRRRPALTCPLRFILSFYRSAASFPRTFAISRRKSRGVQSFVRSVIFADPRDRKFLGLKPLSRVQDFVELSVTSMF